MCRLLFAQSVCWRDVGNRFIDFIFRLNFLRRNVNDEINFDCNYFGRTVSRNSAGYWEHFLYVWPILEQLNRKFTVYLYLTDERAFHFDGEQLAVVSSSREHSPRQDNWLCNNGALLYLLNSSINCSSEKKMEQSLEHFIWCKC